MMFLRITEPTEHVDRTLQTASWWDRYELHPGEYPVEFTTIDWRVVREDQNPYYGGVHIDATLKETYRVNRLFTASSAHTEYPDRPTTVHLSTYAYAFTPTPDKCRTCRRLLTLAEGDVWRDDTGSDVCTNGSGVEGPHSLWYSSYPPFGSVGTLVHGVSLLKRTPARTA